jgi:hypothetical protein
MAIAITVVRETSSTARVLPPLGMRLWDTSAVLAQTILLRRLPHG